MSISKPLATIVVLFVIAVLAVFAWNQLSKRTETEPSSQIGVVLTPTPEITEMPLPETKGGVKIIPETGSNLWVLLFGSLTFGLSGLYLIKKA